MKGKVLLGFVMLVSMLFLFVPAVLADAPKVIQNGDIIISPTPFAQGCATGSLSQGQCGIATTNLISVQVPIKNIGGDMVTPWLIELEPESTGNYLGYQAIISSQSVCNSATPQNVHRTFMLKSGESATIQLTSQVNVLTTLPEYQRFFVNLFTASGCCSSANGCNPVDAPWGNVETVGEVALSKSNPIPCTSTDPLNCVTGSPQPIPACGDGRCDYSYGGQETPTSCPQDCAKVSICGDSFCDSSKETQTNCPIDCRPADPVKVTVTLLTDCTSGFIYNAQTGKCQGCEDKGYVIDAKYNICCPAGTYVDPADHTRCIVDGNPAEANSGKSPALPYDIWKSSTFNQRLKTICNLDSDCAPYNDLTGQNNYSVSCVGDSTINSQLQDAASQFCKQNPTLKGTLVGLFRGVSLGAGVGCTIGAVAGGIATFWGLGAGAIPGCVLGAAALGTAGAGLSVASTSAGYTGFLHCGDQSAELTGNKGACIAKPTKAPGILDFFSGSTHIFGTDVPNIVLMVFSLIALVLIGKSIGGK